MAKVYRKQNNLLAQELKHALYAVLICGVAPLFFYFLHSIFQKFIIDFLSIFLSYFVLTLILIFLFNRQRKLFLIFRSGRLGELRITKELQKLPDSFSVFSGFVPKGRGDIDFVVIGPTGIYAVETKNHSGRIGFDGRNITRNNRKIDDKDILWQAKDGAIKIKKHIISEMNEKHFVDALLVFSSKHARLVFDNREEVREVKVLRFDQLNSHIISKPVKFPDIEVMRLGRMMRSEK